MVATVLRCHLSRLRRCDMVHVGIFSGRGEGPECVECAGICAGTRGDLGLRLRRRLYFIARAFEIAKKGGPQRAERERDAEREALLRERERERTVGKI